MPRLLQKEIGMSEDECDRLRRLLRLSSEPGIPDGRQDAGVLILLDGTPLEYRVFLCIRSEGLRRHPGEVCFPGGMRDGDENMQETAIREAEEGYCRQVMTISVNDRMQVGDYVLITSTGYKGIECDALGIDEDAATSLGEYRWRAPRGLSCTPQMVPWEVGLQRDDFILLGSLPSLGSRFGVLIHPTVALLRRPFFPRLNVDEVQDTFWMPLERFLDDSLHMSYVIDSKYTVHSFSFEEAHTYGVTALMCILTAMSVLQKMPPFDITPLLPVSRLAQMTPAQVVAEVCGYAGQPFMTTSKL